MSLIWPGQNPLCLCLMMPDSISNQKNRRKKKWFNGHNSKAALNIFSHNILHFLFFFHSWWRDGGAVCDCRRGREVEVFWLRGRVFFTLIYQSRRLASYYWDYSLTSDDRLCETAGLFTTCLCDTGWNHRDYTSQTKRLCLHYFLIIILWHHI